MANSKENVVDIVKIFKKDENITGNNKADLLEEVKENKDQYKRDGKYQIVTMTNELWFRITQNGRSFLSEPFSEYFLKRYEIYFVEDIYYIYSKGVYKAVSKKAVKSLIENEMRRFKYIDIKSNWVNEVIERVDNIRYISVEKFDELFNTKKNYINVKNGLIRIDFETGSINFEKHRKDFLSTVQLNVEYKRTGDLEYWNKFINTSLNTDKEKMFFKEILGYLLINHLDNNAQNVYSFYGEGGNGKGTTFRVLREILGTKNVSNCKAKTLTDSDKQNQFYGFEFKNKLAILVPETHYDFKNLELLKQLSGGDRQEVEKKGLCEVLEYDFNGKILISTNGKVKFYDTSKGVKRRFKFLKMDNEIKEEIKNLDSKLRSEKDMIFMWALEGLQQFIKNDFIHTLPESHYEIFEQFMEHSNNYLKFIRKHIKIGGSLIKSELMFLFNEQYGNIYRDKEKLYELFEKELQNEKIDYEIRKYRTKSIINGDIKNTASYVGISFVESKECENDLISENKNNIDCIKERILNELKNISFESAKTCILDYFETIDLNYCNKLSGEVENLCYKRNHIDIFSKESSANQGKDLNKIKLENELTNWCLEIGNSDLQLESKAFLARKIDLLYDSGKFNEFLSEYNKNPTTNKVEFLKAFDIECLPTTIS